MSLQALFTFGVIDLNVETPALPGMDKKPVRGCLRIEGREVALNHLADARGEAKEIGSLDRSIVICKRIQFLCFFSIAFHRAAKPGGTDCPFSKCDDQVM